jgi:flagellar hook-associated protein 2
MSVKIGGVVSGIDTTGIIEKLTAVERKPIEQKEAQQTALLDQSDAIGFITSSLTTLQTKSQALSDPSFFRTKAATVSNSAVGTAVIDNSISSSITNTSVGINISQLSTQTVYRGKSAPAAVFNPSAAISSASGLGASILDSTTGTAVFTIKRNALTAPFSQTFTVNNTTVLDDGTPGSLVGQINATFGAGFASTTYDAATNKYKLVLQPSDFDGNLVFTTQRGSFLQKAQVFNSPNLQTDILPAGTTGADAPSVVLGTDTKWIINGYAIDLSSATDISATATGVVDLINAQSSLTGVRVGLATDAVGGGSDVKFVLQSENSQPISILSGNTGADLMANGKFMAATASSYQANNAAISTLNTLGVLDATTATIGTSGSFYINDPTNLVAANRISYVAGDTLQSVLDQITNSSIGVTANYDSFTNQVTLTNKSLGSFAIDLTGDSGGFLQDFGLTDAAGVQDGTLNAGKSTIFSINGGSARTSDDATLDSSELGVTGLSFSAKSVGATTIAIGADTTKVQTAIDDFINQYNAVQNLIASYTTIDTSNTENSGILASDTTINSLPGQLRLLIGGAFADTASPTLSLRVLEDLGIKGNATDNTFTTSDAAILEDLLNNNVDEVVDFFTDSSGADGIKGLYTQLTSLINAYSDSTSGVLTSRQTNLASEVLRLDDEISLIEARITAETAAWEAAFASFESATAQSQQYSSYLQSFSNNNNNKN